MGQDVVLTCPIYLGGALVAPTEGTVSVYDEAGVAVVDAADVTIAGSIAQYTAAGSLTSDRSPSAGWRVEWDLTLTGGDVVRPRSTAYVVLRRLYPTIADADIAKRVPALAVDFAGRPTTATTYQNQIEDADTEVQRRLITAGRRPWLIVDAWALREVWLTLAIALIYDGLTGTAGSGDPYTERAAHFRGLFEGAWTTATTQLDWDQNGTVDTPNKRTGARRTGWWAC